MLMPFLTIDGVLCMLTVTETSADRLLAFLLRLGYRHQLTLRRVRIIVVNFLVLLHIHCNYFNLQPSHSGRHGIRHSNIAHSDSTFCYSKIYCTLPYRQITVHDHAQRGQANGGGVPLKIIEKFTA